MVLSITNLPLKITTKVIFFFLLKMHKLISSEKKMHNFVLCSVLNCVLETVYMETLLKSFLSVGTPLFINM